MPEPRAARSLGRASALAFASGMTLMILGGLSLLFNVLRPLSAGFLVSIVAIACGIVEWRAAGRLVARDRSAPRWLAWNQLALGAGIFAYGLWQARMLVAADIFAVLHRPYLRPVLDMLPPEEVQWLYELLPPLMRAAYLAVAVLGLLGCAGMAWYYATRQRLLRELSGVRVGA